jgi:hypothetical protein
MAYATWAGNPDKEVQTMLGREARRMTDTVWVLDALARWS